LNLGPDPSNETTLMIGSASGSWPLPVILDASPLKFEFKVIELSGQSALTIQNQLEWSDLATCTGVELGVESLGVLGKRQVWTLMLKIQTQSFGVGTMARNMLSLMNLEEESMCLTSSDGLTAIQSVWKSKDPQFHWPRANTG